MLLAIDLTLTHGGGQQVFLDFLGVLRSSGKDYAALVAGDGWIAGRIAATKECTCTSAPGRSASGLLSRGARLIRFFVTLIRHRRLLKASREIVINDPELFLPGSVLALFLGKKVTLYLHMAYRGHGASVIRLVSALSSVDRLICVSHFVNRHTSGIVTEVARKKLVVVENGLAELDAEEAAPPARGDLTGIAIVGRLVPDKGQDVVCTLSHRLPDITFYLVGPFDNADRAYVDRLRRSSAANVKLVGYQQPVVRYLRDNAIGMVLVPSRIPEACPLVPIEATAAGCAVVVRNLGGLAEVAHNLGLAHVEDDEGFGKAIAAWRSLAPGIRQDRIESARRKAIAHYHPARYARRILEVFACSETARDKG